MDTVDIRERLGAELAERAAPPIGSLVEDAVIVGRRMGRRRRFTSLVAAGVGLALVVVAGLAALPALRPAPAVPALGPAQVGAQPSEPPETSEPAPPTAAASTAVASTGFLPTGDEILAILPGLVPPGSQILNPQIRSSDEFSTSVAFTLDNGGVSGLVSVILQSAVEAVRLECVDGATACQVDIVGTATVRSLYLGEGGELRVDAGLSADRMVVVEADPDVLTRQAGIAIATAGIWLD
jgi:hypothetical protein